MTLEELNQLPEATIRELLKQCCVSERWLDGMLLARPYRSKDQLYHAAEEVWQGLDEADFLEAFLGHPKIGDVNSLGKKYANTKKLAQGEQAGINAASEAVLNALAEGNAAYEKKFGFIFIVCAKDKTADEMLALLQARLHNNRETELNIAAAEQAKIMRLRLEKLC